MVLLPRELWELEEDLLDLLERPPENSLLMLWLSGSALGLEVVVVVVVVAEVLLLM